MRRLGKEINLLIKVNLLQYVFRVLKIVLGGKEEPCSLAAAPTLQSSKSTNFTARYNFGYTSSSGGVWMSHKLEREGKDLQSENLKFVPMDVAFDSLLKDELTVIFEVKRCRLTIIYNLKFFP